MRRGRSGRAGFTMLELITAIFLLSFGIFGITAMLFRAETEIRAAREADVAALALENEWELRRVQPFSELTTGEAQPFLSDAAMLAPLRLVQATVHVAEASPGLKQLTLRVAWVGRTGRQIQKELQALRAEYGT